MQNSTIHQKVPLPTTKSWKLFKKMTFLYGYFTVIRRKMSTAKILINKFGDGSNFKSLYVTIPDEDNNTGIRFEKWTEGIIQTKKKDTEKSSRLIVQIVSGEESKRIDLDKCAKEINNTDYLRSKELTDPVLHVDEASINVINSPELKVLRSGSSDTTYLANAPIQNTQNINNNLDFTNPLEQSLQKVKENNARIMENIHILNRTLNYTKKKEILDIICPKPLRTFPCNACGKCFVYETGLRRHYSMRHAMSDAQPRWQIVWTCIQCFQVWPRQDQALLHSAECCKALLDNQEFIREIKTSLLLQCEFCEKVFTSIPRLLRHSKIHTTDKNYECIPCALTFMSYKIAEQHWPLCPWLKTFYCFYLPKMLLCNACDRKFRNYEQLYNHRYVWR